MNLLPGLLYRWTCFYSWLIISLNSSLLSAGSRSLRSGRLDSRANSPLLLAHLSPYALPLDPAPPLQPARPPRSKPEEERIIKRVRVELLCVRASPLAHLSPFAPVRPPASSPPQTSKVPDRLPHALPLASDHAQVHPPQSAIPPDNGQAAHDRLLSRPFSSCRRFCTNSLALEGPSSWTPLSLFHSSLVSSQLSSAREA